MAASGQRQRGKEWLDIERSISGSSRKERREKEGKVDEEEKKEGG